MNCTSVSQFFYHPCNINFLVHSSKYVAYFVQMHIYPLCILVEACRKHVGNSTFLGRSTNQHEKCSIYKNAIMWFVITYRCNLSQMRGMLCCICYTECSQVQLGNWDYFSQIQTKSKLSINTFYDSKLVISGQLFKVISANATKSCLQFV